MAKKTIATGDTSAGVDVTYDRARRLVTLSGWYDTHVGIAPETITLTRLLFDLGITRGDCVAALSSVMRSRCANCESDQWTYFDGEASVCVDDKACLARVEARRASTCDKAD